jgi:hypothetical protein
MLVDSMPWKSYKSKVFLGFKEKRMKENYKLQNTNYKKITNYNFQNYKRRGIFEVDQVSNQLTINPQSSHGLHQDSFRLQTMTALIKSFCGGSRGAVFSKRAPLAAGSKEEKNRRN